MLKELIEKLQKLSRERVPFDPSRFDDPLAAKIEWSPAKGGGANFKTHNIVQVNRNRIIFRSSIGARVFYGIFLLMGLGFCCCIFLSAIFGRYFQLFVRFALPYFIRFSLCCYWRFAVILWHKADSF